LFYWKCYSTIVFCIFRATYWNWRLASEGLAVLPSEPTLKGAVASNFSTSLTSENRRFYIIELIKVDKCPEDREKHVNFVEWLVFMLWSDFSQTVAVKSYFKPVNSVSGISRV
jgi:hypothetical protein